jgi:hypothetical protein
LSEAVSSLFDAQPANANAAKIAAAPKIRLRSRASIVIGSVASHPGPRSCRLWHLVISDRDPDSTSPPDPKG